MNTTDKKRTPKLSLNKDTLKDLKVSSELKAGFVVQPVTSPKVSCASAFCMI